MKALIYARQSSGKDDLSESVEAQIANCRKLAEKEKLEVVGVFRDLNTSGETYPVGAESIAQLDKAYQQWVMTQSTKKSFRAGLGEAISLFPEIDVLLVNEVSSSARSSATLSQQSAAARSSFWTRTVRWAPRAEPPSEQDTTKLRRRRSRPLRQSAGPSPMQPGSRLWMRPTPVGKQILNQY